MRVCAGWSEPLMVAHTCTTLLEITSRGSLMSSNAIREIKIIANIFEFTVYVLGHEFGRQEGTD